MSTGWPHSGEGKHADTPLGFYGKEDRRPWRELTGLDSPSKRYILAGSVQEARKFCQRHNISWKDVRCLNGSGHDLLGIRGVTVELVGQYWNSPVFNNPGFHSTLVTSGNRLRTIALDPIGRRPTIVITDDSEVEAPINRLALRALVAYWGKKEEKKKTVKPFAGRWSWWYRLLFPIETTLIAALIWLAVVLSAWRLW